MTDRGPSARSTAGRPGVALRIGALVGFVAVSALAGLVGNLLQGPSEDVSATYDALELPAWAPPNQAFGIVWPLLYLLIGLAAWRVWSVAGGLRAAPTAFVLWSAQLVVNAIWPGVFFGLEAYGWGIPVIVALDVLVAATMVAFHRHDRLAAWLLAPYLLWLLCATALNVAVWVLN